MFVVKGSDFDLKIAVKEINDAPSWILMNDEAKIVSVLKSSS